tara:strand:- start:4028 stop:5458 length:1431 start_codon:yes stop_codon:yes gene_type:complete
MMMFDDMVTKAYVNAPSAAADGGVDLTDRAFIDRDLTEFDKPSIIDEPTSWQASNHSRSDTLHVLLVTETWWPDVNGVAMSLQRLMMQMVQMGHKISLVRPKPKQLTYQSMTTPHAPNPLPAQPSKADDFARVPALVINELQVSGMSIPQYSSLQFGLPCYFQIKKACRTLTPDIVHVATEGPLGFAALLAAKHLNIPVTTGYHTQFHNFSKHFGLGVLSTPLMAYLRWFHNASQATCVPSKQTLNVLADTGFHRLYEVGRGVDLVQFNPAHQSATLREQWGAQRQHTVLMVVSRLSPEKGIDLVIQSFYALQRAQPKRAVKLVVVGDGPDRTRLETLAKKGGEDIIFAGTQIGQALSHHYASADAFVFASQVETFGNVVVEAMASGLPVYAFDDAAAGMLVTKDKGELATLGAQQAFIDMVANLPSLAVLQQQGKQAVSGVSGFSWQRPAKQMVAMFYHAIDKHTIDKRAAATGA